MKKEAVFESLKFPEVDYAVIRKPSSVPLDAKRYQAIRKLAILHACDPERFEMIFNQLPEPTLAAEDFDKSIDALITFLELSE